MAGEIAELLQRVEAATGPDRAIDLALATALVPDVLVLRQRDDDSGADPYTHWEYTGSIDDALALVERVTPHRFVSISLRPGGAADVRIENGSLTRGRSGALAVVRALLRSLPGESSN